MKQINNLLIYEVPKDTNYHAISLGEVCTYHDGVLIDTQSLPPGNYEIIGVCSADREKDRMGITAKLDALKHADRRTAPYDVAWRFMELLDDHNITLTDTTDLLFIKKIK